MTQEPSAQDTQELAGIDLLTVALTVLAQRGIPTDVQELLVHGDPMRGIKPSALTAAIMAIAKRLTTKLSAATPPATSSAMEALHGPYGWLNGHRALSEDSWTLESDPLENNEEYFAVPLYALTDPFKEIGKEVPPDAARHDRLDHEKMPSWPPLKKALWDVVTGEKLNDGHYINAYDLTDKLHAAALQAGTGVAVKALPPGWPDPLLSPQAEAIRNGKIDDTEIRNLFDTMEREIRIHRDAHVQAGVAARCVTCNGTRMKEARPGHFEPCPDCAYPAGVESELVEPVAWRSEWNTRTATTSALFSNEGNAHSWAYTRAATVEPLYSAASLSQLHQRIAELGAERDVQFELKKHARKCCDDAEAALSAQSAMIQTDEG